LFESNNQLPLSWIYLYYCGIGMASCWSCLSYFMLTTVLFVPCGGCKKSPHTCNQCCYIFNLIRRSVLVSLSMSSLHRLMVYIYLCPVLFLFGSVWAPCHWFLLLGCVGVAFIERRLSLLICLFKTTLSGTRWHKTPFTLVPFIIQSIC
jgi:hypothetical protein